MHILYDAPGSCSLATHIALEQAGADYQTVRIDLANGQQRSPEFLAVNPKGRVPALVTPRGVLTETPALLAYVARTYPDAGLMPEGDAFGLAQVEAFNAYLAATVHVAHAHNPRASRWADDPAAIADIRRKVPQSVAGCYAVIEDELLRGPWVLGDRYSICDIYLFTLSRWLERDNVDVSRLPRVIAHRDRVGAIPAVAKVVAEA